MSCLEHVPVDAFHAVADPTRRAILDRLRSGGVAVTELAAGFDMTRPAVSKHLRALQSYRSFWPANAMGLKRHLEGGKEAAR